MTATPEAIRSALGVLFDADWYLEAYPDVRGAGLDPLDHYIAHGAATDRNPNPFFDAAWYRARYPDAGLNNEPPLLHYLRLGAAQGRNPHPRFDADYYVRAHPEAASNPLLFHLTVGRGRGWATERAISVADYLPSASPPPPVPEGALADILLIARGGLDAVRRCLVSILGDPDRLPGTLTVATDSATEPTLLDWLAPLAAAGRLRLMRATSRSEIGAAVAHVLRDGGGDLILLAGPVEAARGWTRRLAAQAYAAPRVSAVSALSDGPGPGFYPAVGRPADEVDRAARTANAGRFLACAAEPGLCAFLRRAALEACGGFAGNFAAATELGGWEHRIACDTFVLALEEAKAHATDRLDPLAAPQMALTLATFRRSGLPCVLMVSHGLGGGVARHIAEEVARLRGRANVLLLTPDAFGISVSVPALPGHAPFSVGAEQLDALAAFLQAVPVARAHIHHTMGLDVDLRALLHRLGVPFDVTLHDYFALCPQVTMQPWPHALFCGEPGPASCNACIATWPSHGAADILTWRRGHAWMFLEAGRVLCPSADARERLLRFLPAAPAELAPHEAVAAGDWPVAPPAPPADGVLRVAVLGTLSASKGAAAVAALAASSDPDRIALHLIGSPEEALPDWAAGRIACTDAYREADLPGLIARADPHVIWFPARWPETYSYTLSAAIASGRPIVAARIGAFPERLTGRPLTWLCPPDSFAADWLAAFEAARAALRANPPPPISRTAIATPDPLPPRPAPRPGGMVDLRRPGRLAVVAVPETFANGAPTPCAFIRLLQPLDHLAAGGEVDLVLADAEAARGYVADIIATQRHAIGSPAEAAELGAHCRAHGITLLYDLDDALLDIPPDHPEAEALQPLAPCVEAMLREAGAIWVSTDALRHDLAARGYTASVMPNALDERLWMSSGSRPAKPQPGILRVLYMGTATHDADFALVEPALARLVAETRGQVVFDMIGVSARGDLPDWVNRVAMPQSAGASYPGFVNWITQERRWDIGIAPLADTGFNRRKSPLKALDCAALGLPAIASQGSVFAGSPADGAGGVLAANMPASWHAELLRFAADAALRRRLAEGGWETVLTHHTLAAQAEARRAAWWGLGRKVRDVPFPAEGKGHADRSG